MRVLGGEAVADPTALEAQIRAAQAERLQVLPYLLACVCSLTMQVSHPCSQQLRRVHSSCVSQRARAGARLSEALD